MAKGINVFLIISGRVIPMCEGDRGIYYYNDEGWAVRFGELSVDRGHGAKVDVYSETVAEVSFYEWGFHVEMDELVPEYCPPDYLKDVTTCFQDKWGKIYVMM